MKTIKSQLSLIIAAFIIMLVAQKMLNQQSQSQLKEALDTAAISFSDLRQVKEIEYDLLNLQRTLLLFINTGSFSAKTRFERLRETLNQNLDRLEKSNQDSMTNALDAEAFSRMRSHLADYQTNFQQVVSSRARREELLDQGTLRSMAKLKEYLKRASIDSNKLSKLLLSVNEAELASIKYVSQPKSDLIKVFNAILVNLRTLINDMGDTDDTLTQKVSVVESDFLELTQLIQGNLFLVNVVMAGAANEFLFLSSKLVDDVSSEVERSRIVSQEKSNAAATKSYVFAIISLILAVAASVFAAFRILIPIKNITTVFRRLSNAEKVETIPGLMREDEIGELAVSANVFRDKNDQTEVLLNESQVANAKMESLNTELSTAKQKAEKATESKSIFLANMSHEIRTPMNGVIGLIDLAREQSSEPEVLSYLEKAAYSSQILMTVINDILDFSKIEAGKMQVEKITFSLHDFIDNLSSIISLKAKEKNLPLLLDVDHLLPDKVVGDPLRLSQILMNLTNNAIKFTDRGNITVRFSGVKDNERHELQLSIEVIDSGIGMSEQQLDKIFKPFEQADGSTDRKYGGTGLGLAIVTQLTSLMDGHIKATSEQDVGSCFKVEIKLGMFSGQRNILDDIPKLPSSACYFTNDHYLSNEYCSIVGIDKSCFPKELCDEMMQSASLSHVIIDIETPQEFKKFNNKLSFFVDRKIKVGIVISNLCADAAELTDKRFNALVEPFTPKQFKTFVEYLMAEEQTSNSADEIEQQYKPALLGHVLLVEDNEINQVVAGEILREFGLSFDVAENGEVAVSKMQNVSHYDLILMDVQMPVMDGYTATRLIRENGNADIPIIGLSANAMKEHTVAGFEAGMNDYLTKPIQKEVMKDVLSEYLSRDD